MDMQQSGFGLKWILLCAIIYVGISNTQAIQTGSCISGYSSFQNSCYKLYTDTKRKDDAAKECANNGTHLVDITTQEEQDFMVQMLSNAQSSDVWIGLTASADNEPLFWSDGSPLEFTAWDKQGRDNGDTCVRMNSDHDFKWGDKYCHKHYRYVCEYEDPTLDMSCIVNREIVPEFNNEFRWVLDMDAEHVCDCQQINFGIVTRVVKQRDFQPMYIKCPGKILEVDKKLLDKELHC